MFPKDKRRRTIKPLRKNKYTNNYNASLRARKPIRLMAMIKSPTWKQRLVGLMQFPVTYTQFVAKRFPTFKKLTNGVRFCRSFMQNNLPIAGGALLLCIAVWTAVSIFDSGNQETVLIKQALYPEATAHVHEDIPAGSNVIQRSTLATKRSPKREIVKPKPGLTVLAIDAGHGGVDPGSIGKGGLTEKVITLKIAKKVREKLSSVDKLHVALTRYDDSTINIDDRTDVIKNIGADFVLSLHLNAIPQEHISLVESYYKTNRRVDPRKGDFYIKSSSNKIKTSHALAKSVQSKVFQTVDRYNKVSINAGLKTSPMRILSQNSIPGALVEITCLSNPDEEQRLRTDEYVDELATGIAEGIKVFLQIESAAMTASL